MFCHRLLYLNLMPDYRGLKLMILSLILKSRNISTRFLSSFSQRPVSNQCDIYFTYLLQKQFCRNSFHFMCCSCFVSFISVLFIFIELSKRFTAYNLNTHTAPWQQMSAMPRLVSYRPITPASPATTVFRSLPFSATALALASPATFLSAKPTAKAIVP